MSSRKYNAYAVICLEKPKSQPNRIAQFDAREKHANSTCTFSAAIHMIQSVIVLYHIEVPSVKANHVEYQS